MSFSVLDSETAYIAKMKHDLALIWWSHPIA